MRLRVARGGHKHRKNGGLRTFLVKRRLKLYISFWVFMAAVFGAVVLTQKGEKAKYEAQIFGLEQQLGEQAQRAADLRGRIGDAYSDENVEKRAREAPLGLVYPDEIIIKNDR